MNGQVVHINHQRGMVAVLTSRGEYSILELSCDEMEVGDELKWDGEYPCGFKTIVNATQRRNITVIFQNHCVPKNQLRQQLLYD